MPYEPAVAVLPYGHHQKSGLQATPVDELIWPLGRPDWLYGGTLADLRPQDHLLLYPRTLTHFRRRSGISARISLMLVEPTVVHARHYALLRLTWRRFFRVLTFNEDLLRQIPNGVFFPLGSTWVPEWRELDVTKDRMCSLIASAKRDSEGHQLRHAVADWIRATGQDVTLLGGGYAPFDRKSEGLARYRYSVVIENVRERNYFSEKLLDSVFCSTVPIYWGCPNIEDFIDPEGMILCASEDDIRRAVAAASEADYAARLPALQALQQVLAPYAQVEERAARALLASI
ncbi:hypothetical protein [Seohaeicola zhoushanensis]|uniref:Glycosyltransferase n=1 Tax=Seohaeicola zhoushanensis TaxID=1569283 RepID=A0A8J3M8J1_9RHOB|nr:hypothetical protein [Seohaeicola zhoushanensis]GHF54759.1 hypothetical protein GCM10017056_27810 [Seohaeicola zhoushanensis]